MPIPLPFPYPPTPLGPHTTPHTPTYIWTTHTPHTLGPHPSTPHTHCPTLPHFGHLPLPTPFPLPHTPTPWAHTTHPTPTHTGSVNSLGPSHTRTYGTPHFVPVQFPTHSHTTHRDHIWVHLLCWAGTYLHTLPTTPHPLGSTGTAYLTPGPGIQDRTDSSWVSPPYYQPAFLGACYLPSHPCLSCELRGSFAPTTATLPSCLPGSPPTPFPGLPLGHAHTGRAARSTRCYTAA